MSPFKSCCPLHHKTGLPGGGAFNNCGVSSAPEKSLRGDGSACGLRYGEDDFHQKCLFRCRLRAWPLHKVTPDASSF